MSVNRIALEIARKEALSNHNRYNIGTYKERSRHLILKLYYEPDAANHEVKVGSYTADVLKNNCIVEIQTAAFKSLVSKLNYYFDNNYSVKVVYPINSISRVCWCDTETGSVKEGNYVSYPKAKFKILPELKYILPFFHNSNFSLDLVYCKTSNYKLLDGYGEDKKCRATKTDSIIDDIIDIETIKSLDDVFSFVELSHNTIYTSKLFSKHFRLSGIKLWVAIKFLQEAGIVTLDTTVKSKEKRYLVSM